MKTGILAFFFFLLLLAVPACVELNGQRITIRYDAAHDVLRLILCYDGIHDSGSDENGNGAAQLAEFVTNGDVMLFDWMGHLEKKELRELAAKGSDLPAARAFAAGLAEQIRSVSLGRYRDPDGNAGAAQMVEIRDAGDLIRKANAALNEAILGDDVDDDWARTAKRMRAGAEEGRQWIFLEGHSIGIRFPAHLREWSQRKAELMRDLVAGYARQRDDDTADRDALIQLLASSPLSITETKHNVTIRLGEPTAVSTLRLHYRNVQSTELDAVLEKHVPADLDARIADAILESTDPDPALLALIEWGPPEEQVRALVARLERTEEEEARIALIRRLEEWGKVWNRENGCPEAPGVGADEPVKAWKAWYRETVRFPR